MPIDIWPLARPFIVVVILLAAMHEPKKKKREEGPRMPGPVTDSMNEEVYDAEYEQIR